MLHWSRVWSWPIPDNVVIDPAIVEDQTLGLSIMRYRANLLGGTLEVESGGGGTTVVCTVPEIARLAGERAAGADPKDR